MIRFTHIICSIVPACIGFSVNAQETWAILPEQASCLISNLSQYRKADGQPIVIFVRVCPVVDRIEAMQALQKNSGMPHVTVTPDGTDLDEMIVYSREEIDCLAELAIDLTTSPVLLPKTPCVR